MADPFPPPETRERRVGLWVSAAVHGALILWVALGGALNFLMTVLAAYPLSKSPREFRGRNVYMWTMVFTMLFSGGLIPWYLVISRLRLIDSIWALVLPGAVPGQARLVDMTAVIYPSRTRIPNGTVTTMPYEVPLAEGVVVPANALRYAGGQAFVLVVEDGVAVERRVTVLAEGGGDVVVEGVAAGAVVVSPLPADLIAGSPVTVLGGTER